MNIIANALDFCMQYLLLFRSKRFLRCLLIRKFLFLLKEVVRAFFSLQAVRRGAYNPTVMGALLPSFAVQFPSGLR